MANDLLSDTKIRNSKPGDVLLDGSGLILEVGQKGKRTWYMRGRFNKTRFRKKVGVYSKTEIEGGLTLAEARLVRTKMLNWAENGVDPIVELERERNPIECDEPAEKTFGELAEEYLPEYTAKLTNPKSRQQWFNTFATYVQPMPIWDKPISEVRNVDVTEVLKAHWKDKRETMSRLRGRIERVMNTAIGLEIYHRANPAAWAVQKDLIGDVAKPDRDGKNHTSLEHEALPAFWQNLSYRDGPAADCLRMVILTALRTTECRGAQWSEFDFDRMVWVVPAVRMKMKRVHEVPITSAMMELLESLPGNRKGLLFKNPTKQNRLSENAMLSLLTRMRTAAHNKEGQKVTTHGFRATFRNWVGDMTLFDERLAEHQLAHAIKGTEGHYRTRTALLKRSEMMEQWGHYATGQLEMAALPSNVVALAG